MATELASNGLPVSSEWLFPEYDFARMNTEEYAGVIIERILDRGSWAEIRWLVDCLRQTRHRQMGARSWLSPIGPARVQLLAQHAWHQTLHGAAVGESQMTDGIHWEALAVQTRQTFEALAALPVPADFYLAGGTALAMQIGHRVSYDLDFFSADNPLGEVERSMLVGQLQHLPSVTVKRESAEQLYTNIMGVEASFIFQHHPLLFPTIEVNGLRLAQPIDIGLMKLSAIKDRGTRRDFIDLYCLKSIASFETLFQLCRKSTLIGLISRFIWLTPCNTSKTPKRIRVNCEL